MTRITSRAEILAYARAEHASTPAWPPGFLLAENARDAATYGTCALDGCPVWPGDRVALVPGTGWARLPCLAAMQPPA